MKFNHTRHSEIDDPGSPFSDAELQEVQKKISLLGNTKEALSKYRDLLVELRGREDGFSASIFMSMANIYASLGAAESAIMCAMDAIRCDPSLGNAHLSLATWILENSKRIGFDGLPISTRHAQTSHRLGQQSHGGKIVQLRATELTKTPRVALLTSATGKYARYVPALIKSAETNFLRHCCQVHYFVFTDTEVETDFEDIARAKKEGRLHLMPKVDEGWPYGSLMRVHSYHQHLPVMLGMGMDFFFATDVDVAFSNPVGSEILGERVGTMHPDNLYYSGKEVVGHVERAMRLGDSNAVGKMYRQVGPLLLVIPTVFFSFDTQTVSRV